MLKPEDRIKILTDDKRELRTEMVMYQQGQQSAVLALVVFFGSAVGLYSQPQFVTDPSLRNFLLFSVTEIIYFLALYIVMQAANVAHHAGYIVAVEDKINAIAGEPLTLWESFACTKFVLRGPMVFSFIMMVLLFILAWGYCAFIMLMRLQGAGLRLVIGVEAVILLSLLIGLATERTRLARNMAKAFVVADSPEIRPTQAVERTDTALSHGPAAHR